MLVKEINKRYWAGFEILDRFDLMLLDSNCVLSVGSIKKIWVIANESNDKPAPTIPAIEKSLDIL